jgi:hypothetical protein
MKIINEQCKINIAKLSLNVWVLVIGVDDPFFDPPTTNHHFLIDHGLLLISQFALISIS